MTSRDYFAAFRARNDHFRKAGNSGNSGNSGNRIENRSTPRSIEFPGTRTTSGPAAALGTPDEIEAIIAERQAVAEIDGGVPVEFSWSFASLQTMRPHRVPEEVWRQAIDDAGRFLDQFGETAAALGWDCDYLFPAGGLIWFLEGASVVAVNRVTATLSDGRIFYRFEEA